MCRCARWKAVSRRGARSACRSMALSWCRRPRRLLCKELRRVLEGLEFERVARRIVEEERRLFADFAAEADARLDHEARATGAQSLGQRFPGLPRQHDAEMRHGYILAVDFVEVQRASRGIEVRDELMTEEIEVDPLPRAASLRAAEE